MLRSLSITCLEIKLKLVMWSHTNLEHKIVNELENFLILSFSIKEIFNYLKILAALCSFIQYYRQGKGIV